MTFPTEFFSIFPRRLHRRFEFLPLGSFIERLCKSTQNRGPHRPKGRPLRHTRNICHIQPQSRGTGNQRSTTDVPGSRMEHDNNLSPYMNMRASFVSDSPSSLFRTGITGTGVIDSRASLVVRKLR